MKRAAIIGGVIFGVLILVNVAAGGASSDMNRGEIIGVIVALSVLGIFRLKALRATPSQAGLTRPIP